MLPAPTSVQVTTGTCQRVCGSWCCCWATNSTIHAFRPQLRSDRNRRLLANTHTQTHARSHTCYASPASPQRCRVRVRLCAPPIRLSRRTPTMQSTGSSSCMKYARIVPRVCVCARTRSHLQTVRCGRASLGMSTHTAHTYRLVCSRTKLGAEMAAVQVGLWGSSLRCFRQQILNIHTRTHTHIQVFGCVACGGEL